MIFSPLELSYFIHHRSQQEGCTRMPRSKYRGILLKKLSLILDVSKFVSCWQWFGSLFISRIITLGYRIPVYFGVIFDKLCTYIFLLAYQEKKKKKEHLGAESFHMGHNSYGVVVLWQLFFFRILGIKKIIGS